MLLVVDKIVVDLVLLCKLQRIPRPVERSGRLRQVTLHNRVRVARVVRVVGVVVVVVVVSGGEWWW